ncbi:hypothetical protein BHM03_00010487 [Ensete ventricosum]|nr:hypothetical protein BHM03_00010487 [Ensete ventricosum]
MQGSGRLLQSSEVALRLKGLLPTTRVGRPDTCLLVTVEGGTSDLSAIAKHPTKGETTRPPKKPKIGTRKLSHSAVAREAAKEVANTEEFKLDLVGWSRCYRVWEGSAKPQPSATTLRIPNRGDNRPSGQVANMGKALAFAVPFSRIDPPLWLLICLFNLAESTLCDVFDRLRPRRGWIISVMDNKMVDLRAEIRELKGSTRSEAVAAIEKRAASLQAKINHLRTELSGQIVVWGVAEGAGQREHSPW